MLQLFYSPGSISLPCHIALEEAGADFAIEKVSLVDGEQHQKSFRRLSPQGRVPVLMVHGEILTESLAILDYIDRTFPDAHLLPRDIEQRAQVLSFVAWLATSVHVSIAGVFRPERYTDDEAAKEKIKAFHREKMVAYFGEIESKFQTNQDAGTDSIWLFDAFSLADVYLLPFYRWGNRMQLPMRSNYPLFAAHAKTMIGRDAVRTVMAREGIDLMESP